MQDDGPLHLPPQRMAARDAEVAADIGDDGADGLAADFCGDLFRRGEAERREIGTDLLVSGGRSVRFWKVSDKREVLSVEVPTGPVRALTVNGAGDELTVADQGSPPRVLDLDVLQRELRRLSLDLPGAARVQP